MGKSGYGGPVVGGCGNVVDVDGFVGDGGVVGVRSCGGVVAGGDGSG